MNYYHPDSLEQALQLYQSQSVSIVAGGTDFYPAKPEGPLTSDLLDVTGIDGFRGISHQDGFYRFGAATRWTDIHRADLPPCFKGLQQAAREVGSLQIQNAGTIAGNLCNASPAADGVPPLLTLNARVEVASSTGKRVLPLADFITGIRQTALQPNELVSAILVPDLPTHAGAAFEKLGSRRYLVISITMTAAIIGLNDKGLINLAHIAVGACSPVAKRLKGLEKDIIGCKPDAIDIRDYHLSPLSPIQDVRGSAEFRLDVVAEQCRRAIQKAAATS